MRIGKDKITQSYLKARLALLESYWQKFDTNYYNLLNYEQISSVSYTKEDQYTKAEDSYIALKARLMDLIRDDVTKAGPSPFATAASAPKQIQIAKIDLPMFSEDQLQWEGFRDLFGLLVGEVLDLASVQKLQYLKSSLTGEAVSAIANIELNDKGYEVAWAELVLRYDNQRILFASHMRALINATPIIKVFPVRSGVL